MQLFFFASGWTHIRDPDTRELNSELESTCRLYDACIDQDIPVVAYPHGSQILAVSTGGDYFNLGERGIQARTRTKPFGGYTPVDENAQSHWLLDGISEQDLQVEDFAREFRKYGISLTGSDFKQLVLPDNESSGPAKFAVLFMVHPEYDENLPGYGLMQNVFAKLKE